MWNELEFTGGLWILSDGVSVYFDETGKSHPERLPYIILAKLIERLTAIHITEEPIPVDQVDIERIRTWLTNNPTPWNGSGEDAYRKWYASLAVESIFSGMTLVWAGGIHTALKHKEEVIALLQKALGREKRLCWPEDSLIEIHHLDREEKKSPSMVFFSEFTRPAQEG